MLNGNSDWAEVSKIYDTTDFGYREIRVERPLKLRVEWSEAGKEALLEAKPFQKLDEGSQSKSLPLVQSLLSGGHWMNADNFAKAMDDLFKKSGLKIGAPVKKAILNAFAERDDEAETCTDKIGNPEADTTLRDHELVPLVEDWKDYVAREVTPFVPDAWVDESYTDAQDAKIGRVGYEINFNRYFYQYVPPRPLQEIDAELKALEAEIAGLLQEVVE